VATAQDIFDRAFAYSAANDPEITATSPELLLVLNNRLRRLWRRASKINPAFFGQTEDVAQVGGSWPRPVSAIKVFGVELTDGTEVHIVPPMQREETALAPRVYRLGNKYFTVALAGDPGGGATLRFYFSERPVDLVAATDSLPADLPPEVESLLEVYMAEYLALKDKRRGDLDALTAERQAMEADFDTQVAEADFLESRFDTPR
jgi:hypothetical protein